MTRDAHADVKAPNAAVSEFVLHWQILLAALLGVSFGLNGVWFYSAGLFLKPLQHDFGWSRTQITLVVFVGSMATAVASPLVGLWLDRLGSRMVGTVALMALAGCLLTLSQVSGSITAFAGVYVLSGFVAAGSSPVTFARLVASRFSRRRGQALGIVLAGTGVTGAVLPRFLNEHIALHGWRSGYQWLAALLIVVGPIYFLLARGGGRSADVDPGTGITLADACRSRAFWLMFLAFTTASLGISGFIFHLVPYLTDHGASPCAAGAVASLVGIFVVAGRLGSGAALDRLPPPIVAVGIFAAGALGCLILSLAGVGFAAFASSLVGLALGSEVDLLSFLVVAYFGMQHYGLISGILLAAGIVGSAAGPLVFAAIYDASGSYVAALLLGAVAVSLAAVAAVFLPKTGAVLLTR